MRRKAVLATVLAGTGLLSCGFFLRGSAFAQLVTVHALQAARDLEGPEREDEARELLKAHDWWNKQRAQPNGIPKDAKVRNAASWNKLAEEAARKHRERRKGHADMPPLTWSLVGPTTLTPKPTIAPNITGSSGRVNGLAVDPTNPNLLYAATSYGGVWKTTDAGKTWTSLTDSAPTLSFGAIALDPKNPQTIYAGTGEGSDGYSGIGVLKSTDGGATWNVVGADVMSGYGVVKLFVDGDTGSVYAATERGTLGEGDTCENYTGTAAGRGFFRSKDGGATWQGLLTGLGVSDFDVDPTTMPRKIYVAQDEFHVSLWDESTDTASDVTTLPKTPGPAPFGFAFARAPSNPQIFWVSSAYSDTTKVTLHRSTDGGATFTEITAPQYCQPQCTYDNEILVSPSDPNVVWLGGSLCSLWLSTNAMSATPTWTPISVPSKSCANSNWVTAAVHPDDHALLAVGSSVYFGTDGGVSRSVDGGKSWEALNAGLSTLQYYTMCIDESDTDFYMGAAQDNGMQVSTSGQGDFQVISFGDGASCAISAPQAGAVVLTEGVVQLYSGTSTKMQTFDATPGNCGNAPGCGDRVSWIPPFVNDPSAPQVMYIGTHRVWRSTSAASAGSWQAISGDLTGGTNGQACLGGVTYDFLTALAVAPSNGKSLYSGSGGGVFQASSDGGTTWKKASGLPPRWISGIAVDPMDDATVYAAFSGFDTNAKILGHVFASTDHGATFTLRDIPMDTPVDAIVAHPSRQGVIFAGTDEGVLASDDGGMTWTALSGGLPHVPALSLRYRKADDTLVAGTYGRGIWKLPLAGTLETMPASITLTATMGMKSQNETIDLRSTSQFGPAIPFTLAASAPWLSATAPVTSAASDVNVSVVGDATTLAVGGYDANVTIAPSTAGATPLTVAVHLDVTNAGSGGSGGSSGSAGAATAGQGGAATAGTSGHAGTSAQGGSAHAGSTSSLGGTSGSPSSSSAATPAEQPSGGCGCTVPGDDVPARSLAGFGALALLAVVRRRRSAAS